MTINWKLSLVALTGNNKMKYILFYLNFPIYIKEKSK